MLFIKLLNHAHLEMPHLVVREDLVLDVLHGHEPARHGPIDQRGVRPLQRWEVTCYEQHASRCHMHSHFVPSLVVTAVWE